MAGPRNNEDIRHEELLRALGPVRRHEHQWDEPHKRIVGAAHPETRLFQECRGCGKVRQVSR